MADFQEISYRLIDPCFKQKNEYHAFHNILFKGANVSEEWIQWYHGRKEKLINRIYESRTYAVYDSEKIIGIWSVEPKQFIDKDSNNISVGRCFAVGIHPEYRRLGLFVSLGRYAIEQERLRGEYEYILGFPQAGRSVIGGHLKAGWEIVRNIPIFSYNIIKLKNLISYSQANQIVSFDRLQSPITIPCSFYESAKYRNMRWLNHPDNFYICLEYIRSYIVIKPYSDFCHILDFNGEQKNIEVLLEVVKSLCKRHEWKEINVWCDINDVFRDQLVNSGFIEGSDFGSSVSLIAVKIKAANSLNLGSVCHFQMGIEESY